MASPQTYTVPLEFHKSQSIEITHQEEPAYKAIAQRKQAYLNLEIPKEWRLSPWDIPPGMLSPMESITGAAKYNIPVNVMDIPKICGLLTMEELKITEDWDVNGLLSEIKEGKLKTEDVVRAFCKVVSIHCVILSLLVSLKRTNQEQRSELQLHTNSLAVLPNRCSVKLLIGHAIWTTISSKRASKLVHCMVCQLPSKTPTLSKE